MLLCYCDGSTTWTNTYNADGLRTRRTNGSTTYSYVYNGSSLVQMTVDGSTLYFTYDASGTPQTVTYNDTVYYYVTNLQGDITAILNSTGTTVVSYTYDAWGNHTSGNNGTGTLASTLGRHNPLRYRGYVYDVGTGLYYLQSRFYNPATGRFINADAMAATGQGLLGNNMFSYCLSNPVNYYDRSGEDAIWIQEESNVGTMGHSGLLVQDSATGKWYYFFWGVAAGFTASGLFLGTECTCYVVEVDSDGLDFQKTEDVIQAVTEALSNVDGASEEFKNARSLITATIYLEGDYSATYDYIIELREQANKKTVQYNLITNNCAQVSWNAMAQSDARFSMTGFVVIPNLAFQQVFLFKDFSAEEFAEYLRVQRIAQLVMY